MFRHGLTWLLLEAGLLIAAAAAAAFLHLGPGRIAIVMAGAFALVALLDGAVTRGRARSRPESEPEPAAAERPPPRRRAEELWVEGVRAARLRPATEDSEALLRPPPGPKERWIEETAAQAPPPPALEPIVATAPEPVEQPLPAAAGNGTSWNVWDLHSRAREVAGRNPVKDEEWAFLLLYLREFASPEGLLPSDFDRFVRDSFAELVGRR